MKGKERSTPGKRKKVLEDAILGVDIGSTSTRLYLLSIASGREVPVNSPPFIRSNRHEQGDFSTYCYPFDGSKGDRVYIGNEHDYKRLATSLKPFFLLLSGLSPEDLKPLIQEYPHAEKLQAVVNSEDCQARRSKQRFEKAVAEFLGDIRSHTVEACRREGMQVIRVGISIPKQWPLEVEHYMSKMFRKKFFINSVHLKVHEHDQVFFHTEAQALAHYHFKHHSRELMGPTRKEAVFLLADFGGQNLNISTFQVQYGKGGEMVFFEMGESRGIAGGSEQQDYHIGEFCVNYRTKRGEETPHQLKQELINKFHEVRMHLDSTHDIPHARERLTLRYGKADIPLEPQDIRKTFEDAMRDAFRAIEEELEKWRGWKGPPSIQVLIAGGTARSEALRDKIMYMCERHGLYQPLFTEEWDETGLNRSRNVARGAAYATANDLTVKEFVDRGAAIGVQFREEGNPLWNNKAFILCYMRAELEQELDVKGDDVIKLICDPCLRKPRKTGVIDYRRAYDIWTIGALREGKVKLRAGFIPHDSSEEDLVLFFDLMWCPSLDEGPGPKEWRGGSLTLPLKFDRSSSCAIVVKEEVRDELPREAFVGSKEARADTPGPGTTVQHALPLRVGSGADIRPSPANPDTNNTFAGESNGDVEETRGGEIVNQRVGTRVVYSEPRFELKPESDTMANVLETPPESEPDVIVISD